MPSRAAAGHSRRAAVLPAAAQSGQPGCASKADRAAAVRLPDRRHVRASGHGAAGRQMGGPDAHVGIPAVWRGRLAAAAAAHLAPDACAVTVGQAAGSAPPGPGDGRRGIFARARRRGGDGRAAQPHAPSDARHRPARTNLAERGARVVPPAAYACVGRHRRLQGVGRQVAVRTPAGGRRARAGRCDPNRRLAPQTRRRLIPLAKRLRH
mmetsp:Transcript_27679/g.89415  ORF Transcript_27679/g.89415 Transcript_27679/m.89415 type:complete len:209 (+) Transcript_27679:8163-8789(+)